MFLTAEVRRRLNLTIRGEVTIDRVLFDGTAATGVVAADGAVYRAGEVILSAGSYGSPAILLRSGVGPANELTALGIGVVADLPSAGGCWTTRTFTPPTRWLPGTWR